MINRNLLSESKDKYELGFDDFFRESAFFNRESNDDIKIEDVVASSGLE